MRVLQQQKARLASKIESEQLILGRLPELSVRIIEIARGRGRVTIADAAAITGKNRNTVKDHFKALTKAGQLTKHGEGRGTWYSL